MTTDQARKMILELVEEIDYDIWKEYAAGHDDLVVLVDIVAQYIDLED